MGISVLGSWRGIWWYSDLCSGSLAACSAEKHSVQQEYRSLAPMISNISLSSSGSSSIIKISGIHLTEQGITWPVLTFLMHLSWVSTENPFSVNQDNHNIRSLFPISKTSLSIANLPKTEEESITLNVVFTTQFPPKELPSPCLTLTFLALFHIPNLYARCFPVTKALASVSTTASISSSAKYNLTVRRGVCQGVRPMADDVLLIRFLNPLLNRAPWSWGVCYPTSYSSGLVPVLHCQRTEMSLLLIEPCNLVPGDCFVAGVLYTRI